MRDAIAFWLEPVLVRAVVRQVRGGFATGSRQVRNRRPESPYILAPAPHLRESSLHIEELTGDLIFWKTYSAFVAIANSSPDKNRLPSIFSRKLWECVRARNLPRNESVSARNAASRLPWDPRPKARLTSLPGK